MNPIEVTLFVLLLTLLSLAAYFVSIDDDNDPRFP
jgi:hypothetical protein